MDNVVKHLLGFERFRLDPGQRLLLRDQQPIPLSPKALDLLLVLAQHSGQLVLKDDLRQTLVAYRGSVHSYTAIGHCAEQSPQR